MDELLRKNGIMPFCKFSHSNIISFNPDIIVIGNCVGRGNEEVEWILENRLLKFMSLPEFIMQRFMRGRHRIVISGTHGKTTTTALTAFYLRQIGVPAGYFIGGSPIDFSSGANIGAENAPFVIEGDEYDSAFFDKRSKFIHYAPDTLVVNAIAFDHADIFRDLTDVQRTFNHLLRTIPRNGHVFINGDDTNCSKLAACNWVKFSKVGIASGNDYRICNFSTRDGCSSWDVKFGLSNISVCAQLFGEFNARNATMAILSAHRAMSLPLPANVSLRSFRGVRRRQQILHLAMHYIVYDDFAHHPQAVSEVLRALRDKHENCELICCFEPASNTSVRNVLSDDFIESFRLCDRCYLAPPKNYNSIIESERCSTALIAARLERYGVDAIAFADNDQLLKKLLDVLSSNGNKFRVVVIFSNANFDGVLDYWKNNGNHKNDQAIAAL
jgi:UDP-N-acetylmuramate: L-alanyl-gamma-D-glutamyl-meso-diaminopimelate ligase